MRCGVFYFLLFYLSITIIKYIIKREILEELHNGEVAFYDWKCDDM